MAIEITASHLEIAVRELARLTGERKFIAIGRATLAITAPPALKGMAVSDDIDLWPRDNEKIALDESIVQLGEGGEFHEKNGFYVERVGSWTLLTQPVGWEDRAEVVRVDDSTVQVLSLMDLAYNKLEAARTKDAAFFEEAFSTGLLTAAELRAFVEKHATTPDVQKTLLDRIDRFSA